MLEEERELIAPERFCEWRYEDLVTAPVDLTQQSYEDLDLGGFEDVKPLLEKYVAGMSDYIPNRHNLPPELHEQIASRCAPYIEKYGYSAEAAPQD